jgi:hypothetical protein
MLLHGCLLSGSPIHMRQLERDAEIMPSYAAATTLWPGTMTAKGTPLGIILDSA